MGVSEIITSAQVWVARPSGDGQVRNKAEALRKLAELLANGQNVVGAADVERVLGEREKLQSTGVGGGVAIPHGASDKLERLTGAVLLCPEPIDFDAIDGAPVSIFFAVIGPKRATGEHLKTLARVSRLLRDDGFRHRLLAAPDGAAAYELISAEEGRGAA
jgi:PTS system nitrogen regulatory IIA component